MGVWYHKWRMMSMAIFYRQYLLHLVGYAPWLAYAISYGSHRSSWLQDVRFRLAPIDACLFSASAKFNGPLIRLFKRLDNATLADIAMPSVPLFEHPFVVSIAFRSFNKLSDRHINYSLSACRRKTFLLKIHAPSTIHSQTLPVRATRFRNHH